MTNWELFWSAFGGTATALTVLGALFAFFIQHRLNIRIASFNNELQKDLAKISAELGVVTKRQEIQYSRLHERRAEAIAQLYALVTDTNLILDEALLAFLKKATSKADVVRQKSLVKKVEIIPKNLEVFASQNQIFFPAHLDKYLQELGEVYRIFLFEIYDAIKMHDGTGTVKRLSSAHMAAKMAQGVVRGYFQKLLGVEKDEGPLFYLTERPSED